MAIAVVKEDKEALRSWGIGLDRELEHCHFCGKETDAWHLASNTPVCECCASTRDAHDIPDSPDFLRAAVARAICSACGERPEHVGDARGNAYRWQDYLPSADAAIAAYQAVDKQRRERV
ncbi:hypothetical protein [Burkholderia gladioli]|uniref:hypothetical protein n=1 Tax=Burkholderia gladioli TaxID=28095 RepID=UPI001641AF44|nr:hypothetical protein [Burkholderia gladioli]